LNFISQAVTGNFAMRN